MLPYCHSLVKRILFQSPCNCEVNDLYSLFYCTEVGQQNFLSNSTVSASSTANSSASNDSEKTGGGRLWNLEGLKGELTRQLNRSIKKLEVARGKLADENDKDVDKDKKANIESEIFILQTRIDQIRNLEREVNLRNEATPEIIRQAVELDISDTPPQPNENKKKPKKEAFVAKPRKPYLVFKSLDGIDIYAGRSAEENDELSMKPEHRHDVSGNKARFLKI
jgi:hypothetical protein